MDQILSVVLIVVFVALIAGIAVAVLISHKKETAILEAVPDELKRQLPNYPYTPTPKKDIFVGTGLIVNIEDKNGTSKLTLLFFNPPRGEVYSQTTKMATAAVQARGLQKYQFVPCTMKFDKDMQSHELKSLA